MAGAGGDTTIDDTRVSGERSPSKEPAATVVTDAQLRSGALIRGAELALAALALAAGGYVFASTVRMIVQCWMVIPYWDQWDNLILELDKLFWHAIPLDLPHWLFYQHNEHRILVPRLIFAIDRFLFGMTNKFNFFCNLAIQVTLAALMIYVAVRAARQRIAEKLWIVGAVLALLFSAMQWENLLWGFQVQFLGVDLAALATFAALGLGRPSGPRLAMVILFESIAVYTLSSGMAVPFLAVPLALWVRWPWRYVVILSCAALVLLASYLYSYQTPSHLSDPTSAIWQVRDVLLYVLNEMGNPFGLTFAEAHLRQPMILGWLCGAIGVFLLAAFVIAMLWQRERGGPVPILIATAFFGLGMMSLAALGRLKFGLALSSRYSSPVLMFWASLIVVATIHLRRRDARLRLAGMAVMILVPLGLAYYQPSFAAFGRAWTLPRLEATTALLANVDDPEALVRVYPVPSVPWDRTPLLRERHLSIFADQWSDWLGTLLIDHARLDEPTRCRGGVDQVAAVGASDPRGWRVSGWGWDAERRSVPARIVIADASGHIIGYGLSGFPKAGGGEGGGWHGHFAAALPGSIVAYALLDNGRMACPLGRWTVSP
jgi:hypothetical protein